MLACWLLISADVPSSGVAEYILSFHYSLDYLTANATLLFEPEAGPGFFTYGDFGYGRRAGSISATG